MIFFSYLKKFLFVITAVALSSFMFLAVLEVGLRIFTSPNEDPGHTKTHPERRFELKPNYFGKTYDATLKINSYGLRDYERPISTGSEVTRIAIFGDSFTWGSGVEMHQTFPKVLERKLGQHAKKPIQVFNFGVGGYNTKMEYLYLKESYSRVQPQIVIFQYNVGNDTILTIPPGNIKGINQSKILRQLKDYLRYLYSYSFLASLYYQTNYWFYFKKFSKDEIGARLTHDERLYADHFQGWIETQKVFKEIYHFSREKKLTLIFAVFANNVSLAPKLDEDIMYPFINKVLRALAVNKIENVILLDDSFRSYSGKEEILWVRPDDSHFSAKANELVGEALFQYIIEKELIK